VSHDAIPDTESPRTVEHGFGVVAGVAGGVNDGKDFVPDLAQISAYRCCASDFAAEIGWEIT
jgi:hypothetical protein